MIHYGFAAMWDGGLHLGYSTSLMDIAINAANINLSGQDATKVGVIINIEKFMELYDRENFPTYSASDDPQDGQLNDLKAIYDTACTLIEEYPNENYTHIYIGDDFEMMRQNNDDIYFLPKVENEESD